MKSLISIFFLVCSATAFANPPLDKPQEVRAPIDSIFIPNGFDDNDLLEVVVHGEFPNSCYVIGKGGYVLDTATKEIQVWATALHYEGENLFCAQVQVPFILPVKIGVVLAGDYKVQVMGEATINKMVTVQEATTESPDEFLYAPVNSADILTDHESGRQSLRIAGYYPHLLHGCMVIREVRTVIDPIDVVVVRPIAEIVEDGDVCGQQLDKHYKLTVPLQQPFYGKGLLHVRTLSGQSFNTFLDLR